MDVLLAVWILGVACNLTAWMLAIRVFRIKVYHEHVWHFLGMVAIAMITSWFGFLFLMWICLEEVYHDVEGV